MENQTSFNLNLALERWREELGQSPAFRTENLDELEAHLRDSVKRLQTHGLSEEEAFLVAARRIGKSGPLEIEFAKINGRAVWLDRFLWLLLGAQLWLFLMAIIGSIGRGAVLLGLKGLNYDFTAHARGIPVGLLIAANLALFGGGLALGRWLIHRKGQRFARWAAKILRRRAACIAAFAGLCLISFANYASNVLEAVFIAKTAPREMMMAVSISAQIVNLVQIATLVALTVFLAHKRSRLVQM